MQREKKRQDRNTPVFDLSEFREGTLSATHNRNGYSLKANSLKQIRGDRGHRTLKFDESPVDVLVFGSAVALMLPDHEIVAVAATDFRMKATCGRARGHNLKGGVEKLVGTDEPPPHSLDTCDIVVLFLPDHQVLHSNPITGGYIRPDLIEGPRLRAGKVTDDRI